MLKKIKEDIRYGFQHLYLENYLLRDSQKKIENYKRDRGS